MIENGLTEEAATRGCINPIAEFSPGGQFLFRGFVFRLSLRTADFFEGIFVDSIKQFGIGDTAA